MRLVCRQASQQPCFVDWCCPAADAPDFVQPKYNVDCNYSFGDSVKLIGLKFLGKHYVERYIASSQVMGV